MSSDKENRAKLGVRSRAPNFSKQDQVLLVEAMKPYTHVIECKQTDGIKQVQKQEAWTNITAVFNSNTNGQPRTTENLISFYRNLKTKLKKQHSEAKMMLVDPTQRSSLIKAIEANGKDWSQVASMSSWNNPVLCEEGFRQLEKLSQKEDNKLKKSVMGTGGGPHVPDNYDKDLSQIKKFIEPQIDGLFTIYDSDAQLMAQYQDTVPESQRMQPIEANFVECTISQDFDPLLEDQASEVDDKICAKESHNPIAQECIMKTPKLKSRMEILRKKKEPALSRNETTGRKTANDSFKLLSESKMELVELQKQIARMELEHKQKLHEIELEEIITQNKHKEKIRKHKENMREKELELMNIRIHNAKNGM